MVSLAISIASASSSAGMTRQHRAEDLLLRDGRGVVDVAEHGRLDEVAAVEVLRAAAAGGQRRALLDALGDVALDPVALAVAWPAGPSGSAGSNGSPTLTWREGRRRAPRRTRRAGFACTTIRVSEEQTWPVSRHSAPASVCGGRRDVGVVEDDGGGLAAELEGAAGDALAADRGDPAAGGGRAGEGDLVDARVAHQQLGDLAVGGDDVEHAGGQADLLGDLGQDVARAGRLGRHLDDRPCSRRAAPARPCSAIRPQRRVPRDDRADDADRLAHQQAELAAGQRSGVAARLLERERRRPGSA